MFSWLNVLGCSYFSKISKTKTKSKLYRKLPHQRHPTPYLCNLSHHIRITDHPAIQPRRCILPIPALCGVGCFEDQLPPAVIDYHAELPDQIGGCYRSEDVVQAVVVDSYIRGGFNIGKKY